LIGLKKKLELNNKEKRLLIENYNEKIPIYRQCEIIGLNRATYYLEPKMESEKNLILMDLIDKEYLKHPFLGSRRLAVVMKDYGHIVNRKRIQRLMKIMGIEAIYPKRNLSIGISPVKKYPYLLKNMKITRPNQVWSTDITYIKLVNGFLYLVAVIDWYSRYVISWELSNTLGIDFCLEALEEALKLGTPNIWNNDQGSQFTSPQFVSVLEKSGISISWDGRGRALDNIFIERLWRSLKYEEVYLKEYLNGQEAWNGIGNYFTYYNNNRPHQSLGYRKPAEVHFEK
jgi:putative transposase